MRVGVANFDKTKFQFSDKKVKFNSCINLLCPHAHPAVSKKYTAVGGWCWCLIVNARRRGFQKKRISRQNYTESKRFERLRLLCVDAISVLL